MTLAGGYFQLVVWGIATVVWRVVAEETVISQVALIVILFAGLQTLFNFNPLIKLDGYYMLSDYLEIPNLRAKAMKALHAWLGARNEPLLASDQRRSLLVYGGLPLTFSTLLLLFVYVNIYLLATHYFDFTGLVGFVMFSTFTLKRTAGESVTAARSLGARALIRKYRNLGIGMAFLIAIIVIPWELRISADFRILPQQESIVRAETAGTVDEIFVTEGAHVIAGDLIARLYDPDKEKELSFVEGEPAKKRAELAQLRAGPRAEEIDQAETLVETRRTELANVGRNAQLRLHLESVVAWIGAEMEFALSQAVASGDTFEHRPSECGHCVQDFLTDLDLRDLPGKAAGFELGADDTLPTADLRFYPAALVVPCGHLPGHAAVAADLGNMAIPNRRIPRRLRADHCVLWRRYNHIQGLPIPFPQQIPCGRSIIGAVRQKTRERGIELIQEPG